MEQFGTVHARQYAHPMGKRRQDDKSLHIRAIRVIRGLHFRILVRGITLLCDPRVRILRDSLPCELLQDGVLGVVNRNLALVNPRPSETVG